MLLDGFPQIRARFLDILAAMDVHFVSLDRSGCTPEGFRRFLRARGERLEKTGAAGETLYFASDNHAFRPFTCSQLLKFANVMMI